MSFLLPVMNPPKWEKLGSADHPIDLSDENTPNAALVQQPKYGESLLKKRSAETIVDNTATPTKQLKPMMPNMAPIKLFRTLQMEKSKEKDPLLRDNTTSLRELLLHPTKTIRWLIISNFLIDFSLLLDEIPELLSIDTIFCFYGDSIEVGPLDRLKTACRNKDGSNRFHAICLNPSDPPSSINNPLPKKIPYGVHHSKFFLIGYSDRTLRVVIHTANLVYGDLHLKTDAAYIQDFPLKQESGESSEFEQDLIGYLQTYRYETSHHWNHYDDSSSSKALTITQLLAEFDFSSARAVLIPSVPGYHQGKDIHRYGHMKLRQAVRKKSQTSKSNATVICQFSSMGSLNEKWLNTEFGGSATATDNPKSPVYLVFPTAEEVRTSVEGYAGGASLPSNAKNVEKSFLKPLYHRWSSTAVDHETPFELGRNLPHIKTFFRYDESGTGMQWFVLTSHNISAAAWGQLQKKGQQFFVRHWELGVFLSPETLSSRRLVPLLRMGDSFSTRDAVVPLPYKFHPETYKDGDIPWAWDMVFPKSDHFGRHGL